MIRMPRSFRVVVAGALALALCGCVSLLPKSKPAQLYRFGQTAGAAAPARSGPTVGVFRANGVFQRESGGDRMLTITGDKAAYIAETRWVAPAPQLFDEAVLAAFDGDSGKVRLVSRGEPSKSDYALRLDVRNFEARYLSGPKAAPTVVIRVRAALTRDQDRELIGEQIIESTVIARDNRVSAIVAAYDQAMSEVLGKLVTWTNGAVG
jgi:cholesterol transport system auxiliary component